MRIKSHWFKSEREKTPQEIAGAVAFVIWRIGDNTLKKTRKADFDIAVGTQYFAFLAEFLVFLIQVADRIAYRQLPPDLRISFTSFLVNRIAEIMAENKDRLQGPADHKQGFIDKFNQRSDEYAEFDYDTEGQKYSFNLHFAHCMKQVMDEKDVAWVIDQMVSIEAPEAVEMVEKTMRGLYETEARAPRTRKTPSGFELN
jgi:hypothetical protein